ncbi:hypothetical protein QJQ45_023765 [Haematococcus lacustris]|nr:hypothetical protein QJQ45_023765 [Haematococcus lacustris]
MPLERLLLLAAGVGQEEGKWGSQYNDDVEADFSTEIDPAGELNMSHHARTNSRPSQVLSPTALVPMADHHPISPPGAQQQPLPTSPSPDATPDSSPLHLVQPQHSQTPAAFRSRAHPSPSRRASKDALGVDDSPPAPPPAAQRQQAKPAEQHKAQQRVPSPVHDQDSAAARDQAQAVASRVPSDKDGGYGAAAHAHGLPRQQYLTDMFASSMEFARSGKVITQQQAQIDLLSERLAAANAARRSLEEELQQIATANQESEQRLREVYEARLAESAQAHEAQLAAKSREVVRLLAEVARLKDAGAKGKVLTKSVAGVTLSGEELAGLRRELEEQETLLRGYQAESEASATRIKELEGALREASLVHMPTLPAHEPRPAAAGLMVHQREAAQRLQEVLSLQAQLEALKETSSARELELKAQLDKVRAEKKELEARSAGVDLKMIQEGDVLVKQVQAEMETMRGQYTAMIAELQNKLRWYSENQELLTKNDTLVREQQQVIAQLEERLAQAEGECRQGSIHSVTSMQAGSSGSQGKAKQSRVKELSQQVASLQAALRARVPPNSLAALVQASKPSLEETAAMQTLQARVAALTAQLAAKVRGCMQEGRSVAQQLLYHWGKEMAAAAQSSSSTQQQHPAATGRTRRR